MSTDGMYTRCPACEATYELQVQELVEAAGVVRCSNCGKTFNSLAFLFAQRPEEDGSPLRGGGMPPLLGHRVLLQQEIPGLDDSPISPARPKLASNDDDEPLDPDDLAAAVTPARSGPWMTAAAALLLALGAQLIWLIDLPAQLSSLETPGTIAPQDAITLVARDLHPHPSLSDAVIISATLRNRIDSPIALPILEVRLYDTSNQVLGARRFRPAEYLPTARREDRQLPPGRDLPIIFEVMVTGSMPAGFEFRYFRDT